MVAVQRLLHILIRVCGVSRQEGENQPILQWRLSQECHGHDLLLAGTVLSLESVVWSRLLVRCLINSRWKSLNAGCGIRCFQ